MMIDVNIYKKIRNKNRPIIAKVLPNGVCQIITPLGDMKNIANKELAQKWIDNWIEKNRNKS